MTRGFWKRIILGFILLVIESPCFAVLSYYNLFVVLSEENPGNLYQLKILPNGQIIDPHIQYPLIDRDPSDIEVTSDYRFLYVLTSKYVSQFQIQGDGNLFASGSTNIPTIENKMAITPNNQLMVVTAYGGSSIFTISSTGNLIDTIAGPEISLPKIDPLGRRVLAIRPSGIFSAYTINYNARTLNITTTFPRGLSAQQAFNYTSDGKLGFFYGITPYPYNFSNNLWVLSIASNFRVSTTSQIFDVPINDLVVSKDNKYLWAPTGHYIELFTIDTVGKVTDTGQKYYVLDTTGGTTAFSQRNTLDDSLAVVFFDDYRITPGGSFATAWIGGDGALHWTGSLYAFDSAYPSIGTIKDFLIVPVYVTGVEDEIWENFSLEDYSSVKKSITIPTEFWGKKE